VWAEAGHVHPNRTDACYPLWPTGAAAEVIKNSFTVSTLHPNKGFIMNSIIYIVGLVVVVLFVASFFGLR